MAPFKQTTVPAHLKPEYAGRGRPSDYRPEYCEAVINYMAQGYSLTAFAGTIRQSRDTVYEWMRRHGEFSDAVTVARSARTAFLERKLLMARRSAETVASIFALKNAAPDDWKDVRSVAHDHQHSIHKLTTAQLHAIAAGRAHGDGTVIDGEFVRTEKDETR